MESVLIDETRGLNDAVDSDGEDDATAVVTTFVTVVVDIPLRLMGATVFPVFCEEVAKRVAPLLDSLTFISTRVVTKFTSVFSDQR